MANNNNEFSRAVLDAAARHDIDQLVKAITTFPHLIDAPDHWRKATPMHVAAEKGNVLAIETLVRLGSNAIDTPNNKGLTPLHEAAWNGHVSVIETLVRLGSNAIDTPDSNGRTPLSMTAMYGYVDATKTLVALGAIHLEDESSSIPKMTEDEVVEVRYRVYFSHSLVHRLLTSLFHRS